MSDGFGHERPGEGATNDWISPEKLVRLLGQFDLDPCESDSQPWPCATHGYRLGRGEDGLVLPWDGRVYLNPPYGPHVGKWAAKLKEHGNGILLIFARTETKQWIPVWGGDGFLFPTGRACFYLPDGTRAKSGTAPSVLIAYGQNNVDCLKNCGLAGAFFAGVEYREGVRISTL